MSVFDVARAQTLEDSSRAARSRDNVLSGFSFVDASAPTEAADLGPLVKAPIESPQDSSVVVMDELKVTPLGDRDLAVDIKKTRPLNGASQVKYGTGIHEKNFGKIRASAVTILYVPVLVGFSW